MFYKCINVCQRRSEGGDSKSGQVVKSLILVLVQFVCLVILAVTGPLIASNSLYFLLEIVGLLGGVWAVWTMRLGNFNIVPDVPKDSNLVTEGPYKYVRHPMYSFLLLVTLALVLDHFSKSRLFIWFILLFDLVIKLSYEEELLSGHFADYSSYKKRTKRLIPFLF